MPRAALEVDPDAKTKDEVREYLRSSVKQAGGVLSEVRFDHVDGNLTATYTATMPAAHVENMKVHAVLSQDQRNARNKFLAALQRNHG